MYDVCGAVCMACISLSIGTHTHTHIKRYTHIYKNISLSVCIASMPVRAPDDGCADQPFYDGESIYCTILDPRSLPTTITPCCTSPTVQHTRVDEVAELHICLTRLWPDSRAQHTPHRPQQEKQVRRGSPTRCVCTPHRADNDDDDSRAHGSSVMRNSEQTGLCHTARPHSSHSLQCLHHQDKPPCVRSPHYPCCCACHYCGCCRCSHCMCCISPRLGVCAREEGCAAHVAKSRPQQRHHRHAHHLHRYRHGTPQPSDCLAHNNSSSSSSSTASSNSSTHNSRNRSHATCPTTRSKTTNKPTRRTGHAPHATMTAATTHCDAATQTRPVTPACMSPARSRDGHRPDDGQAGSSSPVLAWNHAHDPCTVISVQPLQARLVRSPTPLSDQLTPPATPAAAAAVTQTSCTQPQVAALVPLSVAPSVHLALPNVHRVEQAMYVKMPQLTAPPPEPVQTSSPHVSDTHKSKDTHHTAASEAAETLAGMKEETLPAVRPVVSHANSALTSFALPRRRLSSPQEVHAPLHRARNTATRTAMATTPVLWDMRAKREQENAGVEWDHQQHTKDDRVDAHVRSAHAPCEAMQSASVVHLSASRGLAATRTNTTVCADAFSTTVYDPYTGLDTVWHRPQYRSRHGAIAEEDEASSTRTVTADAFTSASSESSPLLSSQSSIVWPM